MAANGNGSTSSRLIRLESEAKAIKEDVQVLTNKVDIFIEESQEWREQQGKINWSMVTSIAIGALGIMVSACGAMITFLLGVISISWLVLNSEIAKVQAQFTASDEVRNVQYAQSQRQDAIVWNALREMGAKLPEAPGGPFYAPHVTSPGPSKSP